MNLYKLKTRSVTSTYYVVAEHPTQAQEYLKKMLDLAEYDFYDKRTTVEITFIAKLVTEKDWNGKPCFNEGDNLLIVKVGTEGNELKDRILTEYKEGNIVVVEYDGSLRSTLLTEFIKQPVEGMLYDLNRDEATVLTFVDDPKWINDYAVCQVIRALKSRIDELLKDKGEEK